MHLKKSSFVVWGEVILKLKLTFLTIGIGSGIGVGAFRRRPPSYSYSYSYVLIRGYSYIIAKIASRNVAHKAANTDDSILVFVSYSYF